MEVVRRLLVACASSAAVLVLGAPAVALAQQEEEPPIYPVPQPEPTTTTTEPPPPTTTTIAPTTTVPEQILEFPPPPPDPADPGGCVNEADATAIVVGAPLVLRGPPGSLRADHRILVDDALVDAIRDGRVLRVSTDDLPPGSYSLEAECSGRVVLVVQFDVVAASTGSGAGGGTTMFIGLLLALGFVFFLRPDRWRLFAPPS